MTVKPPPTPPEPPFSVREPFLLLEEGVTRITLVRHAQQDYPVSDAFVADEWEDPHLSGLGRTQAMALAAVLGEEDVDVIACSTMLRAMQTAQIVASPHGIEPIVRAELAEIDSYRDIPDGVDPQTLVEPAEWKRREDLFRREVRWDHMFFSEGSAEFRLRVLTAIDRLLDEHQGQHIVLVSHGGVINAFLGSILGVQEDMFFLPNHCSISTVAVKGDVRRVRSINEHQHLHTGILTN
ncbi:MAG: histidine phosphatase family protein [Actinobacteria bacterium]|nr:histidine phosphatase family protein [Actinomycetota bacterium]